MLTAIACFVIGATSFTLIATFIESWNREFDTDLKGFDMTIQEERQLRIQGEALLEAAVDVCRRGLGEAASDVRLSVMHLTDGRWRIVADLRDSFKDWTDHDREKVLQKFAAEFSKERSVS